MLAASIWLADLTLKRFVRREMGDTPGCLAMLALTALYMLALGLVFYPGIEALQRHACAGAEDFELCMEPAPGEY